MADISAIKLPNGTTYEKTCQTCHGSGKVTNRKTIKGTKVSLKKLKKKKYYIRIRAFKKENNKNIYGKWSKVKKIKVKK